MCFKSTSFIIFAEDKCKLSMKRIYLHIYLSVIVLLLFSCTKNDHSFNPTPVPQIIEYSINGQPARIENTVHGITMMSVSLPYGTDISSLTARFSTSDCTDITVDGTDQVSAVTQNNFSMPVIYELKNNGVSNYYTVSIAYSNLPVLYINTPSEVDSRITWIENSTVFLTNAGGMSNIYSSANIKGRGNTTWKYPKKPFSIKLKSKEKILGMAKDKHWALIANYLDRTYIRNALTYLIEQQTDGISWIPEGRYVDLVLNGKFLGNYFLCEKVRVSKKRIDISPEGCLLEFDINFDEDNKFKTQRLNMPVNIQYPDNGELSRSMYDSIKNYINRFETLVTAKDFPSDGEYRSMIDINSFADWYLVTELINNAELSHPKSVFMYIDKDGKLCMATQWDNDWGTFQTPELWAARPHFYYKYLMADKQFQDTIVQRWNMLRPRLERIMPQIDSLYRVTYKSCLYDSQLWESSMEHSPNKDAHLSQDSAIMCLKEYLKKRIGWLDREFNNY